jgi:hypothetical protein
VPAEDVAISIQIPGYRLSDRNRSLDPDDPKKLTGHIDRDMELKILLEPEK